MLKKILSYIILAIGWACFFWASSYYSDIYLWGRVKSEQDLVVLKKTEHKIIIPYVYSFSDDNKFIDYVRENNTTKVVKVLRKQLNKEYDSNLKKKDKLYDTFTILKTGLRYDVNLSQLWKYNFVDLVEQFSTAPYYDTKNKTLYVFSHSSWKILNPWADYFNVEQWDRLEFLDFDSQALDTYEVETRDILPEKEFYDSIFTNIKDRIVLVTCYPLNSNQKRLYITLKKVG